MRLIWINFVLSTIFAALPFISGCNGTKERPRTTQTEKKERVGKVETQISEHAPSKPQRLRWEKKIHAYTATLKSTMSAGASQVMLQLNMASEVNLFPAETKSEEDLLLMVLVNPEVHIEGERRPSLEQEKRLRQELAQPVWGRYRGGKLQKLYLPKRPSAFAVGIWRTLLSGIQVAAPINGQQQSFETTEFDNNGEYQVVYNHIEAGKWEKRKLSYVKGLHLPDSESPVGLAPTPKLKTSKGEVIIAGDGLHAVTLDESINVPLTEGSRLSGTTALHIARSGDGTATKPGATVAPPSNALVLSASEPYAQALPVDAMDDQRMRGLTFDDTLKALVARSRDPRRKALWEKQEQKHGRAKDDTVAKAWTEDWSRYFIALPAFFRQQPETLKIAENQIRKGSPATQSLFGGLSSSGSPGAQALLARLALDQKLDRELRLSAVRNLVQCKMPTKETAEVVWGMAGDSILSRYSVFGIGIIARKLRKAGETESAGLILSNLINRLGSISDPNEKRDVLRGISNTGDPAAYESIKPLIADPNPTIRGGAVEAVRLMEIPEADRLIADRILLENEPAAGVRVSAINSASNRSHEEPLLSVLIDAASNDPEDKVRRAARKVLLAWSRDTLALKPILAQIADADERETL